MGGVGAEVVTVGEAGGIVLELITLLVVGVDYLPEFGKGYFHGCEFAPEELGQMASVNGR